MEEEQDLRVKVFYDRQALILYFRDGPTLDYFYGKIREACKLTPNQPITVKWIDTEDDPVSFAVSIRDELIRT